MGRRSCGIETVALDARDLHKFAQDAHCANLKCTPPRPRLGACLSMGTEFDEAHPASLRFFDKLIFSCYARRCRGITLNLSN